MPETTVDVRTIANETRFNCADLWFTVMLGQTLLERNRRRSSRGTVAYTGPQPLDPLPIFGKMQSYLQAYKTCGVDKTFVAWVCGEFQSNPRDFLFLVVEHANKTQEIVGYLWAGYEKHLYPHATYTRHLIVTFGRNRLGNLLLRVHEFKMSEMARAAGVPHWTSYLNFAPGILSTLYGKAGYVDACLPSDVDMVDAKLDDVHTKGLVKQISNPLDNFLVTIGARDPPADDRASQASTPTNTPDMPTSRSPCTRRAPETSDDGPRRRVTRSMTALP